MEVANKVGSADIIGRVVDDLKDESEQYRKMVLETIEKVKLILFLFSATTVNPTFFPMVFTRIDFSDFSCFYSPWYRV